MPLSCQISRSVVSRQKQAWCAPQWADWAMNRLLLLGAGLLAGLGSDWGTRPPQVGARAKARPCSSGPGQLVLPGSYCYKLRPASVLYASCLERTR